MSPYARAPVWLSYAAFMLVGVGAGVNGVLLPAQMAGYGVDRAGIGLTFFTGSAGFALAGLSTGALIGRCGVRIALTAGGGSYVLAGLYLATRPPFPAFVLVQLVTGSSAGVLESALNVYLAALPDATAPGTPDPVPRRMLSAALRDRGVQLGAAMLALYVGLELSVGN
jgi:fucose permease